MCRLQVFRLDQTCIDLSNIRGDLRVLPVNVMVCKQVLVIWTIMILRCHEGTEKRGGASVDLPRRVCYQAPRMLTGTFLRACHHAEVVP